MRTPTLESNSFSGETFTAPPHLSSGILRRTPVAPIVEGSIFDVGVSTESDNISLDSGFESITQGPEEEFSLEGGMFEMTSGIEFTVEGIAVDGAVGEGAEAGIDNSSGFETEGFDMGEGNDSASE